MTGTRFPAARMQATLMYLICVGLCSGVATAQEPGSSAVAMTAEDHLALAETQFEQGLPVEAGASLSKALEMLREAGSQEPTHVIDAYVRIGDMYQRRGEHERALGAYSEAQNITRRAFGLSHTAEVELLRKSADSFVVVGEPDLAIALHREANGLLVQAYGRRSIQAREAALYLANWLSEHGMPGQAAVEYSLAARFLKTFPEHDPLEVVDLLRKSAAHSFTASAQAFRGELGKPGQLLEALDIAQPGLLVWPERVRYTGLGSEIDNVPRYGCLDVDAKIIQEERVDQPLLLAEILRDIGDWCIGLGVSQQFENAHVLAWDLLALVENGDQIRSEWFGAPTAVYTPKLEARALSDRDDAPVGRIELSFTVDDDGSTGRIEVVNAHPEGILDKWAVRRVRRSKFRPRMEDGQFVSARTSTVIEFRYDPAFAR